MKVFYTGKYREPSVCYRGETFMEGVATDVTQEWLAENQCDKLALEVNPPVVDEAPKKRGRPAKVKDDHDD